MDNKYLLVNDDVILNDYLASVITSCDIYFENNVHRVSSGIRKQEDQLRIIIDYANKYNFKVDFTKLDSDKVLDNGNYVWQDAWSRLLNIGFPYTNKAIIINPPNSAICLYDYVSNRTKRNMKGLFIETSPHIKKLAFDIDVCDSMDLDNVVGIINYAKSKNNFIKQSLSSPTEEPANKCLHINLNPSRITV